MVFGPDTGRDARPADFNEIDALLRMAFDGEGEVELVHALRRDGDMVLEFVKPWQGRIAGYAALSRMVEPQGWLCLAPVAVLPAYQRGALAPDGQPKKLWQVGRRMVHELLTALPLLEARIVVVLGQPGFYEKCGFSRARAVRLTTPYPIEYTMIAGPGEDVPQETLIYPPAFGSQGGE